MAKKIINPEDQEQKETVENTENKAEENTEEIPAHIEEVLKKNTKYESLYIDSYGGCFTGDTPANIRGNAILYKNPFYKQ
ncbi:hypothetical protein [Dysgonomonas termitidis]|uniref:Uncharacterized protein n=1 Tax=Dysgonomonas termitidis TaxID=1516126 RepID=A0ABV9KR78_9BACT